MDPLMRALPLALALLLLSGCAVFPDLEQKESAAARAAAPPGIIPLDGIFAREADIGADPRADDAGRAARLRNRAAALRRVDG